MNTKYRLGRSALRTLEEGMEKEWLITNGIGGFANGSVTGANHRLFSGYLTASFHPPVDRKIIWSGTHEKLVFDNKREADFTAQAYVGEVKEGFKYLNTHETALWESLVGKPRGKATDPLIHAKGSVTLLLQLGRKAHVHAPTQDDD